MTDLNFEKLRNLFLEWSSLVDKNKLILIDDYIYKDHLLEKMRPTTAYTYALGLDLALNYSVEKEFLNDNNNTTLSTTDISLKSQNKEISKKCNQLYQCKLCDFKAETLVILDHHLAQPHFYTTVFVCNFCTCFKTNSKEEYKNHVLKEHNRISYIEKPLVPYACQKCNFESDKQEKLAKHEQLTCPFKGIDSVINNLLAPSKYDFLEFEYLFNEKPIETTECNSALLDMSTYQTHFHYEKPFNYEFNINLQAKIIQNLIDEYKQSTSHSIVTIIKQPLNLISTKMNNLFYKCYICSMIFLGENRLKSLNEHLKIAHKITDEKVISNLSIMPTLKPFSFVSTIQKPLVIKISNNYSSDQNFDFNNEKKFINEILLKNKDDLLFNKNTECLLNQIIEFKGKCFKCLGSHVIESNLLDHFNSAHNSNVKSITSELVCLFCGFKFMNREKLIIHQFNTHKSISFLSINKLFTVSNSGNHSNLIINNTIQDNNQKKQVCILPKTIELPIFVIPINEIKDEKPNETKKRIFFTKNEPKSKKIKNIKEEKCHFCLSSFDSRVKYNIHLQSVHMKDAGVHLVDFRLNNKKFIKYNSK
jgi:hypothetical protein